MHSKENHEQDKKTTLRMGENICKWNNSQKINLQNIQTAYGAQSKKISNQKWVEDLKRHNSKKTYRWQRGPWKDAQHHELLEKYKSKLQWDITFPQSNGCHQKNVQTVIAREGTQRRELSLTRWL